MRRTIQKKPARHDPVQAWRGLTDRHIDYATRRWFDYTAISTHDAFGGVKSSFVPTIFTAQWRSAYLRFSFWAVRRVAHGERRL